MHDVYCTMNCRISDMVLVVSILFGCAAAAHRGGDPRLLTDDGENVYDAPSPIFRRGSVVQIGVRTGDVHTFASGHSYEGDTVENLFHGRGVYTYPSGESYDGDWVDDQKHGRGVYTYAHEGSFDGHRWRWANWRHIACITYFVCQCLIIVPYHLPLYYAPLHACTICFAASASAKLDGVGFFDEWPWAPWTYFALGLGALVIALKVSPLSLVTDVRLWRTERAHTRKRAVKLQLPRVVGSVAHSKAALRAHQARQMAQIKQQRNAKALRKAKRTREQRARHISAAIGTAQGAARAASKSSKAAARAARRARAKLLKTRERFGAVLSAACAAARGAAHSALTAHDAVCFYLPLHFKRILLTI